MTLELWMLLATAMLMLALPLIYSPGYARAVGAQTFGGNRENMPAVEGWFARAKRAHANLGENLTPFAAVVLVAHEAGVHSGWTRAGTVLFLAARVVHAISYTTGFTPTRGPAYVAGIIGTAMVAGPVLALL